MTTTTHNDPTWWNPNLDSGWERTKAAFKRDWDQTKHDMGGNEPDTDQQIGDTLKQAAGKEAIPPRRVPTYDELEPAYRFGYGARSTFSEEYPEWDDDLEARLKEEWKTMDPSRGETWEQDRDAIRHGWDYEED